MPVATPDKMLSLIAPGAQVVVRDEEWWYGPWPRPRRMACGCAAWAPPRWCVTPKRRAVLHDRT